MDRRQSAGCMQRVTRQGVLLCGLADIMLPRCVHGEHGTTTGASTTSPDHHHHHHHPALSSSAPGGRPPVPGTGYGSQRSMDPRGIKRGPPDRGPGRGPEDRGSQHVPLHFRVLVPVRKVRGSLKARGVGQPRPQAVAATPSSRARHCCCAASAPPATTSRRAAPRHGQTPCPAAVGCDRDARASCCCGCCAAGGHALRPRALAAPCAADWTPACPQTARRPLSHAP